MHGPLISSDESPSSEKSKSSIRQCMLLSIIFCAAIGGFLFGFDTGVISGVLLVLERDRFRGISELAEEWIVTSTLIGAAIGSLIAGKASDSFGRQRVILVGALLFLVGAINMGVADSLMTLIVGRSIVGLGIGVSSGVVPVYISELSPPHLRGRLVTVQNLCITTGQFISYLTDLAFVPLGRDSWRFMLGIAGVPAALLLLGTLFLLPESPRWLLARGRRQKAIKALKKMYTKPHEQCESLEKAMGKDTTAESPASMKDDSDDFFEERDRVAQSKGQIIQSTEISSTHYPDRREEESFWSRVCHDRGLRRALLAGIGLQVFQQLIGINIAMYYSGKILLEAGFGGSSLPPSPSSSSSPTSSPAPSSIDVVTPMALSCAVALLNAVFTLLALWLVDRTGRRRLLFYTLPGVVLGMFMIGLGFYFQDYQSNQNVGSALCFIGLMVFVGFFATGMGPVPWAVNSEIYPTEVRSVANGIATSCNWLTNIIISSQFLTLEGAIGKAATFWIFAGIACFAMLFVYRFVPETKGMSLEAIQNQLFK